MEDELEYTPEEVAESAEATPEDTGEQTEIEESGEVEEVAEPTPAEPEEKTVPLKAVQEERRKRQEAKQEAEYWRKVATGEIENPNKPAEPEVKPKPTDFEDYDQYVEALTEYKARQIVRAEQENTHKLTREQIAQREAAQLQEKVKRDADAAVKKYPDFFDVAGTVTLPQQSLQAMYQSEVGAEIAYYLGKNQAELERIADLPPARQIMELGKLEVKLAAKTANPEKKVVKQPTTVESAGNGFPQAKPDLTKLREEAQRTGDWTKYLEQKGVL